MRSQLGFWHAHTLVLSTTHLSARKSFVQLLHRLTDVHICTLLLTPFLTLGTVENTPHIFG